MKIKTLAALLGICMGICMAVVLALNAVGCNAFTRSTDGTVQINQPTLAADIALVRGVIAVQAPQLLPKFDQAASISEIAAILATAPPAVTAAAPPDAQAAAARIKAAATQPSK